MQNRQIIFKTLSKISMSLSFARYRQNYPTSKYESIIFHYRVFYFLEANLTYTGFYLNGCINTHIQFVVLYSIIYACIRFVENLHTLGIGQTTQPQKNYRKTSQNGSKIPLVACIFHNFEDTHVKVGFLWYTSTRWLP